MKGSYLSTLPPGVSPTDPLTYCSMSDNDHYAHLRRYGHTEVEQGPSKHDPGQYGVVTAHILNLGTSRENHIETERNTI